MLNSFLDRFKLSTNAYVYAKPRGRSGLTIDTIKLIALITMIFDHIGFVLINNGKLYGYDIFLYSYAITLPEAGPWIVVRDILRTIGRISFPLFAFSLSEGFHNTSNIYKYATRLFVFALISEVPFDLACFNTPFYFEYQNIFWTLLIGLLGMIAINKISKEVWILRIFAFIGFCFVGDFIHCDYGWEGVAFIMACDICRNNKLLQTAVIAAAGGILSQTRAGFGAFAAIFTWFYNGKKRENNLKYLYYIIYPLHLLLFYLIVLISSILMKGEIR